MKGYKAAEYNSADLGERSLMAQCQAIADMKFTYVVSYQQYGTDKRSGEARAKDILKLMRTYDLRSFYLLVCYFFRWVFTVPSAFFPGCSYPSLRVAYIDEVEEPISEERSNEASKENSVGKSKDKFKPKVQKVYYSKLVKVPAKRSDSTEPVQNLDQVSSIALKL